MATAKTSFPIRKPKKIPTLAETPRLARETSDLVAAMKLLFQGEQILLNSSSEIEFFGLPMSLQLVNEAGDYTVGLVQSSWGAGDYWTQQTFMKSRGATFNAHGDVLDGDHMGSIVWYGSKNASWFPAMDLSVTAESPDADSVPARFRLRAFNQATDEIIMMRATPTVGSGAIGIGIDANPVRTLHPWHTSVNTNTVMQLLRLTHTTTGTPAAGIGVGMEFEQETSAGNNEVLATIEAIASVVTAGSEQGGLSFKTMTAGAAANEVMRLYSNQVVIGTSTSPPVLGATAKLNITGDSNVWGQVVGIYSADPAGATMVFTKSRHATIGSHTIVQANDLIGRLLFFGSDGTDYAPIAEIQASSDGTPGNNDMPGRLAFLTTADGANSATERLRITSAGRLVSSVGAVPQFWVYWTANSTTIVASYNMTSIADTAVGDADGTIAVDFADANWAGWVCTNDSADGWDAEECQSAGFNARAAGTFGVLCSTITDGATAVTSLTDPDEWQVFGLGISA